MFDPVPNLLLKFDIDVVTLLEFLDSLQAFSPAHDPAVPEGDLDTSHLIFNPKFDVLAVVPVVVGGLDDGLHT